jgi:hypothetical protein
VDLADRRRALAVAGNVLALHRPAQVRATAAAA